MQSEKSESSDEGEYFSKLANPAYVSIEPEYKGPGLSLPIDLQQIKDLIEAFKKHKVVI